jgi:class 3 adenylate cyclase
VDAVLERTDDDLRLGGTRDIGTGMFTDLRDFTSFSESTAPQRVIELLNEYFSEMITRSLDREALSWATRRRHPHRLRRTHPDRGPRRPVPRRGGRDARSATPALQPLAPRARLGRRLRDGNRAEQRVLHVGERRLAAAARVHVHGHTVNTASRLEAITKTTGRSILVAESTHDALLNPPHDLSFVGELDVRGRQSKILDLETLVHVGRFAVVAALISLLPAACGGGDSGEEPAAAPGAETGDPATDAAAMATDGTTRGIASSSGDPTAGPASTSAVAAYPPPWGAAGVDRTGAGAHRSWPPIRRAAGMSWLAERVSKRRTCDDQHTQRA